MEVGFLFHLAKERHHKSNKLEYEAIIKDSGFTDRTVDRLIKIYKCKLIKDNLEIMPASWGTLYALAELDPKVFGKAIADGRVNPDMFRRDVSDIKNGIVRSDKKDDATMTDPFKDKIKSLIVYFDTIDGDLVEKAMNVLSTVSSNVHVDRTPFDKAEKSEIEKDQERITNAPEKARKNAIKLIKITQAERKLKHGKKFKDVCKEFIDFFETDPYRRDLIEDPINAETGVNEIDEMLKYCDRQETCESLFQEALID